MAEQGPYAASQPWQDPFVRPGLKGLVLPELILERVLTSIRLPSVQAILRAGGVGVGTRGRVRVVNGARSTMFDPRALVEVGIHIEIDISEAGHSIESAEAAVLDGATSAP